MRWKAAVISLAVDKTRPQSFVLPLWKNKIRCLRPPPCLFDNKPLLLNISGSKWELVESAGGARNWQFAVYNIAGLVSRCVVGIAQDWNIIIFFSNRRWCSMFSTKIMYPWGLEKLKMDAPLEVSSFSRPQNYTVKPPLTARIRMLHPPRKTPPPGTSTQSSRCGEVRPHTKQTYYRYSIISSSASIIIKRREYRCL